MDQVNFIVKYNKAIQEAVFEKLKEFPEAGLATRQDFLDLVLFGCGAATNKMLEGER